MLNQFGHAKIAIRHTFPRLCDSSKTLDTIKGGITDEAFQEQCFLWERGASADSDLFLTFKIFYIHKNLLNTKRKKPKSVRGLLAETLSVAMSYWTMICKTAI